MGRKQLIDIWRSGSRSGYKIRDVREELERLGYTLTMNRENHYKVEHPRLKGSPRFPLGFFIVSAHAHGNQGEVHMKAITDILGAQAYLEATTSDE